MKEIISMHGWGSDSSSWKQWKEYFLRHGWQWQSGERGYGGLPSESPTWQNSLHDPCNAKRVVIAHSLGPHLIQKEVHQHATHLVLLASFSSFAPKVNKSRSLPTALEGMQRLLGSNDEQKMLNNFLLKASFPLSTNCLPPGPIQKGLTHQGRQRLKEDLDLLIQTSQLPTGICTNANVLIVNAEEDAIVTSAAKKKLLEDLAMVQKTPPAEWEIKGAGHSLISPGLIKKIYNWLEQ